MDWKLFASTFGIDGVRYNLFGSPPPGASLLVGGILGADFLLGRSLTVDYQARAGYLFSDPADLLPIDAEVEAAESFGFTLLGGGQFNIPDGGGRWGEWAPEGTPLVVGSR